MNSPQGFAEISVNGLRLRLPPDTHRIGRGPDNEIVLDDPSVSTSHATISFLNGRFGLSDQGSSNGTFLNGRKILSAPLNDGDQISVGEVAMAFHCSEIPEAPASRNARASVPLPTSQPNTGSSPITASGFSWWPRNWIASFVTSAFIGMILLTLGDKPIGDLVFIIGFFYGFLTAVRFLIFKYLPTAASRLPVPRRANPFWKRPAFIGLAAISVVVSANVTNTVSKIKSVRADVASYAAQNSAALDQHTSFSTFADMLLGSFVSGAQGDILTPILAGIEHDNQTRTLQSSVQGAAVVNEALLKKQWHAEGIVDRSIYLLVILGISAVVSMLRRLGNLSSPPVSTLLVALFTFSFALSKSHAQTISLDKYYDTPMQGGSSVMEDLATLLSPFVKAAPNTAAPPGQQIFGGVTYLMPLEEAKTALGISSRTPSRTMLACAGFPQKSLFAYAFEGAFEGHFNQCVFVTDQASQVVCISLVADSPKEDLVSSLYGTGDWHTYNFILARNKSLTRLEINHRITYLREKKDQWQLYYPTDPPPASGQTLAVRIDTCLTDPGTRNGYRTSPRKALEASRLYLPKPMMELILHCIQKAKR